LAGYIAEITFLRPPLLIVLWSFKLRAGFHAEHAL